MSDIKHNPESWSKNELVNLGVDQVNILSSDGSLVAVAFGAENAARIVACVNACKGLSQEALDGGWSSTGLSSYAKSLEKQRDYLLKDLNRIIGLAELGAAPLHKYAAAIQQSKDLIAKVEQENGN
jgi:hypothetical protein